MEKPQARWTLGEIAKLLGGELHGPTDMPIHRPVAVQTEDPLGIAFAQDEAYLKIAEASTVGALLVPIGVATHKPSIQIAQPRESFGKLLFLAHRPIPLNPGVHSTAVISPSAQVHASAQIGPYVVVEAGAVIEEGVRVYPYAYVGDGCHVGAHSVIYPHVVLVQDVHLGAGTVVHSGSVLGTDGFGYAWNGDRHVKIPQVGEVRTGENVEIGALTTVDRATAGATTIGNGTKLDNLVMVAHNVHIGNHTVIASQTGLAGSSEIGDRVAMAGQCAVGDHKKVGDDVTFAGQTGAAQDIGEPGVYFGMPARPLKEAQRRLMLQLRLPEFFQRLKAVERALERIVGSKPEEPQ